MRELVFNITAEHDGKQAYHYLRYCEHFSYALIVKMRHTENSLLLDGVPIRTIDKIKAGSVLKAYIPEGESYFTPNPDLEIEMLYGLFEHPDCRLLCQWVLQSVLQLFRLEIAFPGILLSDGFYRSR